MLYCIVLYCIVLYCIVLYCIVLYCIIDGAKTHLTLHLSNFCAQNGIKLYCLYPNATHIIQPADASVFRPIKLGWRQAVHKWQGDNPNKYLTKVNVAPLLANVFKSQGQAHSRHRLFLLDPNVVDYTKCEGLAAKRN